MTERLRELRFPSPTNRSPRDPVAWATHDDNDPIRSVTAHELWSAFAGGSFGDAAEDDITDVSATSSDSSSAPRASSTQRIPNSARQSTMAAPATYDHATCTAMAPRVVISPDMYDSQCGGKEEDRVYAAELELRFIYDKHATLEQTVQQLEQQWKERQRKYQARINTLRAKEKELQQQLEEASKCHREEIQNLMIQKEQALESQQRLLRLAAEQDRKLQHQLQRLQQQEEQILRQEQRLQSQERALELQNQRLMQQTDTIRLQGLTSRQMWDTLQIAMEEKCAEWQSQECVHLKRLCDFNAELMQKQTTEVAQLKDKLNQVQGGRYGHTREELCHHVCLLQEQLTHQQQENEVMQLSLTQQLELMRSQNDRLQRLANDRQHVIDKLQKDMQVAQQSLSFQELQELRTEVSALREALRLRVAEESMEERAQVARSLEASPTPTQMSGMEGGDLLWRQLETVQRYNAQLLRQNAVLEDSERRVRKQNQQLLDEFDILRKKCEGEANASVVQLRALLSAAQSKSDEQSMGRATAEATLRRLEQELHQLQKLHSGCQQEQSRLATLVAEGKARLLELQAALDSRTNEVQRLRLLQHCSNRRGLRDLRDGSLNSTFTSPSPSPPHPNSGFM